MAQRKIIRITERYIHPNMEMRVKEVMESVENEVRKTKGLIRIETMQDRSDPNRHVVITEWKSRAYLRQWLESDLCKQSVEKLETVLQKRSGAREFVLHEDDVFLL